MGSKTPTCYLNTPQAAAILGLSPRTLETYRLTGGGPPFLTYCNRVRYLRSDLDAWAIAGRRRSTSDDGAGGGTQEGQPEQAGRVNGARWGRRLSRRPAGANGKAPRATACGGETDGIASGHLSVRELAALLQVSRRTLDRYRAKGVGPAFEKVNGRVLYARADVEAWIASGRREISPASGGTPASDGGDDECGPAPSPGSGEDGQ